MEGILRGGRNAPYCDFCVAYYKALVTTHSQIFCARIRNLLQQRSESYIYGSLQYLHINRNNCNKNLLLISILRAVILMQMSGSKYNKSD